MCHALLGSSNLPLQIAAVGFLVDALGQQFVVIFSAFILLTVSLAILERASSCGTTQAAVLLLRLGWSALINVRSGRSDNKIIFDGSFQHFRHFVGGSWRIRITRGCSPPIR